MNAQLLTILLVISNALTAGCTDRPQTEHMKNEVTESIEQFENRKKYPILTEEILRTIPDADVEQAIFDYAVSKIGDKLTHEEAVIRTLSPGIQALYSTWLVEAEVNNGGFNQFFWNSSGAFAADAVRGFELFELPELAQLTREAIAIHKREAAIMEKFKRQGTLEAFSESYKHTQLDPLDKRFYEVGDKISPARIRRIRERPEIFEGT